MSGAATDLAAWEAELAPLGWNQHGELVPTGRFTITCSACSYVERTNDPVYAFVLAGLHVQRRPCAGTSEDVTVTDASSAGGGGSGG